MPRCDFQDRRCEENGYARPEFPDRKLCTKHYEQCLEIHNSLIIALENEGFFKMQAAAGLKRNNVIGED